MSTDRGSGRRELSSTFNRNKAPDADAKLRIELAREQRKRQDLLDRARKIDDPATNKTVSSALTAERRIIQRRDQKERQDTERSRLKSFEAQERRKKERPQARHDMPAPRWVQGKDRKIALNDREMREVKAAASTRLKADNKQISDRVRLDAMTASNKVINDAVNRAEKQPLRVQFRQNAQNITQSKHQRSGRSR